MPGKGEPKGGEGFYDAALTEAERLRLPSAREVEGIDEEIAVLRTRLFTAVQMQPYRLDLVMGAVAMLVRATALRYRISPQSEDDLAGSLAGVVTRLGASLGLGEFDDSA